MKVENAEEFTPVAINTSRTSITPVDNNDNSECFSPQKKMSKTSAVPAVSHPSPHSMPSPSEGKVDRDARVLNLSLESSLLFTLRAEAATNGVVFMQQEAMTCDLINATNLSMLIFSRLSEKSSEMQSAVSYLVGCYKRIQAKEMSAAPKIQESLAK